MHILTCENPQRVFNEFSGEYVWTRCGKCNSCRNARAAKWTSRIERERTYHRFSLFVTLTYDDIHLPVMRASDAFGKVFYNDDTILYSSNKDDIISFSCRDFRNRFCTLKQDKDLFYAFLENGGLPYCSSTDLQLFHKRLNKYFHDKYTKKYSNFRYFVCSEYGSTTFRPHFHGIYFVDDSNVAEYFAEAVLSVWKKGRVDCQFVEKSAGGYVAQYVNKSVGLPEFYTNGPLQQKFYFSRFPTVGVMPQSEAEVQKSFDLLSVCRVDRKSSSSSQVVLIPNDSGFENRLYPKCFQFKSLSDTCRIKLYTIICRFPALGFGEFAEMIRRYKISCQSWKGIDYCENSDYYRLIEEMIGDFSCLTDQALTWLRRVYYVSKRFMNNCKRFGLSVFDYYKRICDYWSKKELYVLSQFYKFQSEYVEKVKDSDSLVMMYSEYCHVTFGENWLGYLEDMLEPRDVLLMRADAANYSVSNRLTHFKNAYLDFKSLDSCKPIYSQIKSYVYAKKCYEVD